ncbi:angiopoietin-related protein 6-like [Mizuhopecten yessoensis]|uniref:angiopoietin-related protein 6-like n=1 Tax=Mizuhopecten yessoensis TaxID=6573 RepID=UPI000B45D955|nr:angiopoietin-related protein 6-like [Mizuhopecten yessoensis]
MPAELMVWYRNRARHRLSLDLTTDGYTYFQKRNEGENRFVRLAETYVFNNKTWTVVQKRYDGSQSFNRDWNEYKNGFGDPYGEYWIGLEAMHQLIARSPHALLIILESWAGVMKHALYDQFYLASKTDHYRLNVSGYSGTAGNCLEEMGHNYMAFSTKDKDNDLAAGSCANSFKSGYWYSQCSSCNINGPMKPDTGRQDRYAVIWFTFSNKFMPLRKIKMLISRMP